MFRSPEKRPAEPIQDGRRLPIGIAEAIMANNPTNMTNPDDPRIATLWSQWLGLDAARTAARGSGTSLEPELDLKLHAVSLLIAAVPATTWADVLPKVTVAAMLRDQDAPEASHVLAMIEAAVALDHERLQPSADGSPRAH